MNEDNFLRVAVIMKYKSIAAFARELGWTRQKAHRIVEHQTMPSLKDIDEMSKALGISLSNTAQFFLQQ